MAQDGSRRPYGAYASKRLVAKPHSSRELGMARRRKRQRRAVTVGLRPRLTSGRDWWGYAKREEFGYPPHPPPPPPAIPPPPRPLPHVHPPPHPPPAASPPL
eukprot:9470663-Pyramimonas_sp.AAC.1